MKALCNKNKQKEAESQNQAMQMQVESNERMKQLDMQLRDLISQRENETKLQVALIGKEGDYTEEDQADIEKIKLQRDKLEQDYKIKMSDLEERVRHNKATESISKNKPQPNKK